MTRRPRYTLAVHCTVVTVLFVAHTVTAVVVATNGAGNSVRDVATIWVALLVCWAGIAMSWWLFTRAQRRRSERFARSLESPATRTGVQR